MPIRVRSAAPIVALAVAIVVALGLAGCGAAPPPAGSPFVPVTVAPSGRPPAPTLPPNSPRVLGPAPYVIETMRPSFSLNLPEGFVLQHLAVDQFFITQGPDPVGRGIALVRLERGEVVSALNGAPGFVGRTLVDVRMGSLVGHSIALTPAPGLTEPPHVLSSAELQTAYVLPLGAQGRVIEFSIEGAPVAVYYFAPAADFAAFEQTAQGILGSLAFRS